MTLHVTHLTSEEMPEPGQLRRVVSVHPGNRSYETEPAGQESGWLVVDPAGTNNVFWPDAQVDEVHPSGQWVKRGDVPAAVISRHGAQTEPATSEPPKPRRGGRRRAEPETTADANGEAAGVNLEDALSDGETDRGSEE